MAKRKIKRRRSYQRVENPKKMLKQMTRDHLDVLHSIESFIVNTCQSCKDIDDRTIALALKSAIEDCESEDKLTSELVIDLARFRRMFTLVPDDIWTKGLKVVLDSVHTHSDRKPGCKDYLNFIRNFIK